MEDELCGKSHLNQILLDNMPCVALLLRPLTREIVASNQAAIKIGAVPGTQCFATWGKRDNPCPWCLAPKLWKSGQPQHLEVETLGVVWDAYWAPVGPDLYMHYAFDITERRKVADALLQSEKRFRDIVENAQAWIWEVDAEGRYTYSSPIVEEFLGYKPLELLGKHFYELFHHQERQALKEAALQVFAAKQPFREFLNCNLHKNGQSIWLLTNGVPILDEQGNLLGYRGADINITKRKETEEALQESEEKYRFLVDQIPAVVFRGNADWSVELFDRKIEELTGYTKEDFDSRQVRWCDLIPPEDLDYAQKVFLEALRSDRSYVREHRIRRKDGEIRWVQCRGRIFCDADGNIEYISGVTFDITERKQAEAALKKRKKASENAPSSYRRF